MANTKVPTEIVATARAEGTTSRIRFVAGDRTVSTEESNALVALATAMKAAGCMSPLDELLDHIKGDGAVVNSTRTGVDA